MRRPSVRALPGPRDHARRARVLRGLRCHCSHLHFITSHLMTSIVRASLLVALAAAPLAAQAPKKLIGKAEWDSWRSIQGATISNDGKWVAYTLSPGVGDGEFVVRSTASPTEYRG